MKKKVLLSITCLMLILAFNFKSLKGQASIDLETGALVTGYNNVITYKKA